MAVGGAKETTVITLAKASDLTLTAFTAAAVVTALRMPAQGGWATARLHVVPAASQAASQAARPGGGGSIGESSSAGPHDAPETLAPLAPARNCPEAVCTTGFPGAACARGLRTAPAPATPALPGTAR